MAMVSNGRVQKFRPKKNADTMRLAGRPVNAAWKEVGLRRSADCSRVEELLRAREFQAFLYLE